VKWNVQLGGVRQAFNVHEGGNYRSKLVMAEPSDFEFYEPKQRALLLVERL
jgi:hypothetical protein